MTLQPKPKFAAELSAAAKLLVRETETVKGPARVTCHRLEIRMVAA